MNDELSKVGMSKEDFLAHVEKAKAKFRDDPMYQFAIRLQERITPIALEELAAIRRQTTDAEAIQLFSATMGAIIFSTAGQMSKPGAEGMVAAAIIQSVGDGVKSGVLAIQNNRATRSAANTN